MEAMLIYIVNKVKVLYLVDSVHPRFLSNKSSFSETFYIA
jgi:hypothetical protein